MSNTPQSEPQPGTATETGTETGSVTGTESGTATETSTETDADIVTVTETESVVGDDTVTIHRAPRYLRFMIAGAVVGLIVALILTLAFPEPPGFDYSQVFGFLALFIGVLGFAAGALVALLVDRASRRAAKTIRVELLEGSDSEPAGAPENQRQPQAPSQDELSPSNDEVTPLNRPGDPTN